MRQISNLPYLEPYKSQRSRYTCPQCKKPHEFSRYINPETGGYYADHVGKCNRLYHCGYHYPPRDYFRDNPRPDADKWRQSELYLTAYEPPALEPVVYIPADKMQATLRAYDQNNFCRFLTRLFDETTARRIAARYHIGTSKRIRNAGGLATIFWQIDAAGNVRHGKVMGYDPETGRRLKSEAGAEIWSDYQKAYKPAQEAKDIDTRFIGKTIAGKDANLVQCLFGEHLLPERPDDVVCIVESEKTACIMSEAEPQYIWIATGGKYGAKWNDIQTLEPLRGRSVVMVPDLGAYAVWSDRGRILNVVCANVVVSDFLEKAAPGDVANGWDIADYYIADKLHDSQNENIRQEIQPAQGEPITDSDLPPGFQIIEFENGRTLEIDGLPSQWLNDDEHAAAMRRLGASGQLKVMALLHPAVGQLIDVFGLEA